MITLISHFVRENHAPLYATTYLLGQFDEKKSYESFNFLKFWNKGL
jgi:hypothetical protein